MTTHSLPAVRTPTGAATPGQARQLRAWALPALLWLVPMVCWHAARTGGRGRSWPRRAGLLLAWATAGLLGTTLWLLAAVLLPGASVWWHERALCVVRRSRGQGPWRLSATTAFPSGQGHGARLVSAVCDAADGAHDGAGVAVVSACRSERTAAFYARHGFRARHVASDSWLRLRRPVRP